MTVTRAYQCTRTGVQFEFPQRITEGPLTQCAHCGHSKCVPKRLINLNSDVHFRSGESGGWSSTGYSKPEHERRAEGILGRKLRKSKK